MGVCLHWSIQSAKIFRRVNENCLCRPLLRSKLNCNFMSCWISIFHTGHFHHSTKMKGLFAPFSQIHKSQLSLFKMGFSDKGRSDQILAMAMRIHFWMESTEYLINTVPTKCAYGIAKWNSCLWPKDFRAEREIFWKYCGRIEIFMQILWKK